MTDFKTRRGDIPVRTEQELLDEHWVCAFCHEKTHGPDCTHCGSPRQDALIVVPDGEVGEELIERLRTNRRCGHCVYFSHRKGQEEMNSPREQLFLKLIKEMEMREVAANMDWKLAGLCEQWSGGQEDLFITCANSPARCAKKHLGDVPYAEKDQNVECPAYKPRGGDGKEIRSYRMVKNSRTVGTD